MKWLIIIALALLMLMAGCDLPKYEGPQMHQGNNYIYFNTTNDTIQ